jgi:hypothetical protein
MRSSPLLSRPALLLLLALPLSVHAQSVLATIGPDAKETAPSAPGGTVTGRVIYADTNGPARFAKVLLKSVAPSDAGDNPFAALMDAAAKDSKANPAKSKLSAADQAELKQQQAASAKLMATVADMMVATTIGADGTYLFTNVKAGTYYVHATAPGYIDALSQFSAEDLASTDPAIRRKIAAVATPITVTGTDQVRSDLRLERGASISGRVLYDDGTPAAGWTVRTVHPAPPSAGAPASATAFGTGIDLADLDLAHISEMAQTDDTGHYRIAGLPSGDYILQARFTGAALGHSSFNPIATNVGSPFSGGGMADLQGLKLTVYSGNAIRGANAEKVSVRAGDDRTGYDLTMPLHAMHTLAGIVRAKSDAHPVNSGTVDLTLLDAQGNPDPTLHLTAGIQPDGTFHFDYIPGNASYTLKTLHAVDATTLSVKKMFGSMIAEQKTTHSYGPASTTVVVGDGDILDLKLDVPELPAAN